MDKTFKKLEKIQRKIKENKYPSGEDILKYYDDVRNTITDLINETHNHYKYEEFFNDFCDKETLKILIEDKINNDDLDWIKNQLKDINLYNNIWRFNGYGWLQDVTIDTINDLLDDLIIELKNDNI